MNTTKVKKELTEILSQDLTRSCMVEHIITVIERIAAEETECERCGADSSATYCKNCTHDKEKEAEDAGFENGRTEGYKEGLSDGHAGITL